MPDFAQILITEARTLYACDSFAGNLDQAVYDLDSTTIDLCLSLFPWADLRKHKGAVKLHTLLDLHGNILDDLIIEAGAIYIMDRGYLDFGGFTEFVRPRPPFPGATQFYRS